jgi:hypothetical protein
MVKFAWGVHKLLLCLVSKLWFSMFVMKGLCFELQTSIKIIDIVMSKAKYVVS